MFKVDDCGLRIQDISAQRCCQYEEGKKRDDVGWDILSEMAR